MKTKFFSIFLLLSALLWATVSNAQETENHLYKNEKNNETIYQSLQLKSTDQTDNKANTSLVDDEFYNQLITIFDCDIKSYASELISIEKSNYGWKSEYYKFAKELNGFQLKLEKRQQYDQTPKWSLGGYKAPTANSEQFYDALVEKLKSYGSVSVDTPTFYKFKGIKLTPFGKDNYYIFISLNKYSEYVSGNNEDNSISIYVSEKSKTAIIGSYNVNDNNKPSSKKYVTCSQCNGKGNLGVIENTKQKRYEYEKDALGNYKYKGSSTTGVNEICPKCLGKGKVYE